MKTKECKDRLFELSGEKGWKRVKKYKDENKNVIRIFENSNRRVLINTGQNDTEFVTISDERLTSNVGGIFYAVKWDEDCQGLVIIFGSQEEIDDECVCGDGQIIEQLVNELEDSTELCEDYLIESERFTEPEQIDEVKRIVEKYGYVENRELLNCEWS